MGTSREYLSFVLEQLSDLEDITYRPMMGEYVIYYRGRVAGGVYDDRLLIKPVKAALQLLPDAPTELPYEGAKPMLMPDIDDKDGLTRLFRAIYDELPVPKPRKKK